MVKIKLNPRRGTARIVLELPGPGRLELSGKGLRRVAKRVAAAGRATLKATPLRGAKKKLIANGDLRLLASVAFTPLEGEKRVKRPKLTLRLRPSK